MFSSLKHGYYKLTQEIVKKGQKKREKKQPSGTMHADDKQEIICMLTPSL